MSELSRSVHPVRDTAAYTELREAAERFAREIARSFPFTALGVSEILLRVQEAQLQVVVHLESPSQELRVELCTDDRQLSLPYADSANRKP